MKIIIKFFILFATSLYANEADILKVEHNCNKDMICDFSVTIKHNDEGWKHYVNKYEVLSQSGKVLATRVLFHPHVDEQPFTRSLSNVKIPKQSKSVTLRGHDLVHKYGGKELKIKLIK